MQKRYSWTFARRAEVAFESRATYSGILTFLVAFALRLVPEIIAGPWPLGFDTVTYYLPIVMGWARGGLNPLSPNAYAPLLYYILLLFQLVLGNIFLALKLLGPLLYGSLVCSFFFFLVKGLDWRHKKALLASLFFSFYFVSMRISWDLFRNMLGLVFLLVALPFLLQFNEQSSRRRFVILALTILVTLSHELATVVMFFTILVCFSMNVLRGKWTIRQFAKFSLWLVPSLLLFTFLMALSAAIFHEVPGSINYFVDVQRGITYDSYYILAHDILGCFLLSYGLILPLVAWGFFHNKALDAWFFICLFGSFWPLFFPWFEIAPWNRWMYMVDIPMIVYATNGLERLTNKKGSVKAVVPKKPSWLSSVLILSGVIIVGLGYAALPLSTITPRNPTLERLSLYIPGGLLSNTFPICNNGDLERNLQWVNNRLDSNSVLIYHESLTGWVDLYISREKNVITYHFRSSLDGLEEALSKGYDTVYVIWWVDGSGWYGQRSVSEEFGQPVFVSSRIGVFSYVRS